MTTNYDEENCTGCGEPTEGLSASGRSRICRNPKCPVDKDCWVDDDPTEPNAGYVYQDGPDGFRMQDEPKKKKKIKLDLEILDLDDLFEIDTNGDAD
jgi:hypothetical protein